MKQTILATALALSLVAGTAFAHPKHATAEGDQTWRGGPGMMMDQGTGMRGPGGQWHGMMGMHGKGMGMMGMHGKGMGMMGNKGQCMMGQGMHGAGIMGGYHGMMDSAQIEQQNAFLDATNELRKNIHDKIFEYMEASRNPEETVGSLREKQKELSTLHQELQTKREEFFTKK